MHAKLKTALALLDMLDATATYDEPAAATSTLSNSGESRAKALFTYLDLAGYLSDALLEKAADYLSIERPFAGPKEVMVGYLQRACAEARRSGQFDADLFLARFCRQDEFHITDIIDFIIFLSQTAFDRTFGVERDRLNIPSFLTNEEKKQLFLSLATELGVVRESRPSHPTYCATGIMGAASGRARARVEHFNRLRAEKGDACGRVWALTGYRELSQGLDEDQIMIEMAERLGRPFALVEKGTGAARRSFLEDVTEAMMVNYLIQTLCPDANIALVDSAAEENHWRATTAQGADDIAKILVGEIQQGRIPHEAGEPYHVMIIAEQPYLERMQRQVQRAFDAEIRETQRLSAPIGTGSLFSGRPEPIEIRVEGIGLGLSATDAGTLTRVNSEIAASMAERYNDACLRLAQQHPDLPLRHSEIMMFAKRDADKQTLESQQPTERQALTMG